jgi:hypothetical protein
VTALTAVRRRLHRTESGLPKGEDELIGTISRLLVSASGAGQYAGRHRDPARDGWPAARPVPGGPERSR